MTHTTNTHLACLAIQERIAEHVDPSDDSDSLWKQVRWFWCLAAATELQEMPMTLKDMASCIADNDWPTVPHFSDTRDHVAYAQDELAWLEDDDEQAYIDCVKNMLDEWGWT